MSLVAAVCIGRRPNSELLDCNRTHSRIRYPAAWENRLTIPPTPACAATNYRHGLRGLPQINGKYIDKPSPALKTPGRVP